MDVRVLSPELTLLGDIGVCQNVQLTRRLYRPGVFTLTLKPDDPYAQRLLPGNIIMLDRNPQKCGIIEYREERLDVGKETLTVKGRTLEGLLTERLTVPPSQTEQYYEGWDRIRGPAETVMKHYVSAHFSEAESPERNFPLLTVAPDLERGGEFPWQARFTPVSDVLADMFEYTRMGYAITLDLAAKKLVFDVVPGTDHTAGQSINGRVVFSRGFGNLSTLVYTRDSFEYRNVGYAGGAGQDEDRLIYQIGEASGIDRREVFLDCGGAEIDELIDTGTAKLAEYAPRVSVEAEVQQGPFYCGVHYDLGDWVTVEDKSRGLVMDTQIIEMTEIHERSGEPSWQHVFGSKIPTTRNLYPKEVR